MDYKLELVPLPVADVNRAKAFYAEKAGFVEDLGQFASEEGKAAFDLLLGQAMHNKRPAVTGLVKVL